MSFHVGQHVCCIDDGRDRTTNSPLLKGTVYTVAEVRYAYWDGKPCDALLLAEVSPPPGWALFAGPCFRPVDETRIEVFRKIAANPRIEVEA